MALGSNTRARGEDHPVAQSVFLSFATEDQLLADAFRAQAVSSRSDLVFRDYSVRESFESSWKTKVERLLQVCSVTICLVGKATYKSDAVNWEVRKSAELGNQVIAVWLGADLQRFPAALEELGVTPVPWDFDAIMPKLASVAV